MSQSSTAPSRWDRLFDLKPIPLIDQLTDDMAKLLVAEFTKWPIEGDANAAAAQSPRPSAAVYAEAFRFAEFELDRNLDGTLDYVRNRRWTEHALTDDERPNIELIARVMLEHLYGIHEATEGRVNRQRLRALLDKARPAVLQALVS